MGNSVDGRLKKGETIAPLVWIRSVPSDILCRRAYFESRSGERDVGTPNWGPEFRAIRIASQPNPRPAPHPKPSTHLFRMRWVEHLTSDSARSGKPILLDN